MKTNFSKSREERFEVLFTLDEKKIKAYCIKHGIHIPKDDIAFWGRVYKTICYAPNAPSELVIKAKLWLYSHGMTERVTL